MQTKTRLDGYNEQTTRFVNRFPEWHPARGKVNSNWRKLLNPMVGDVLKEVLDYQSHVTSGQHLSITPINMPSKLYTTPSTTDEDLLNAPANIIRNSDFSIDTTDGYLYWTDTGSAYEQVISAQASKNRPFYLSVSGGSISKVTLEGANITTGADYTYEASDFSSVIDLTGSDAKELTKITVTGNPAGARIALWFDDIHYGWSRYPEETPYWLFIEEEDPYDLVGDGRKVYYVDSVDDMFRRTPATSAALLDTNVSTTTEPITSGRTSFDFKVEFFGELYPIEFRLQNGSIQKVIDGSVISTYQLEEMQPSGALDLVDSEIIAIHLQDENIVALVRDGETTSSSSSINSSSSSSGSTTYTYSLLWIAPDTPEIEDGILTVIKRVILTNTPFLETGTITLAGTLRDAYRLFVVSTDEETLIREIDLKYDYYFVDAENDDIVFRENYTTLTGLSAYDPVYSPYFNLLDEHGLIRDFPRLEEETNYDYKQRMINYSSVYDTGCNNRDILNAISLRLGRDIQSGILTINDNVAIVKRQEAVYISLPTSISTETLSPDPNYAYTTLTYPIRDIVSVKVDDQVLPPALYHHDEFSLILEFNHYIDPAKTATIKVQYRYYDTEWDVTGWSVGDVGRALQAMDLSVDADLTYTDLDRLNALNIADVDEEGTDIELDYLPVRISTFDEDAFAAFQDLSITDQELNSAHRRAIELRNLLHDTWERQVVGRDRWDMISNNLIGGGTLRAYNDGFFSWLLDTNGSLLGRVDMQDGASYHVQGTKLEDIQSGVNATLDDFEVFKDLEVVGISDSYKPQVTPGFFYIGEMQFYLYIDKQRDKLTDLIYYELDADSLSEALDGRELRSINGIDYKRIGQTIYVADEVVGSSSSSLSDSQAAYNISLSIVGVDGTVVNENHHLAIGTEEHYFLSTSHNARAPIIMTDFSVELQEVQFSVDENDKLTLLSEDVYTPELYIEYESDLTSEYAEIDYDVRYKRGFFYIKMTDTFEEALIEDLNFGLYNGPGKGRHRIIYDADETSSPGINFEPPLKTESDFTMFDAPTAPAYTSNDNYYDGDLAGWGFLWGEDFGN